MCNNYISCQPTFVSFSKWAVVWKNQWDSKTLKFKTLLTEKLKHIKQTFKILLGVILKTQDLAGKKFKVSPSKVGATWPISCHNNIMVCYQMMGLQSFFSPALSISHVKIMSHNFCIQHVCKTELHEALFRPCWQDLATNSRESPTEQFKDW